MTTVATGPKRWSTPVPSHYLGNDAAELRSILCEGQQVADGTADGVNVVR